MYYGWTTIIREVKLGQKRCAIKKKKKSFKKRRVDKLFPVFVHLHCAQMYILSLHRNQSINNYKEFNLVLSSRFRCSLALISSHGRHQVQNLLGAKIHTSCKISNFVNISGAEHKSAWVTSSSYINLTMKLLIKSQEQKCNLTFWGEAVFNFCFRYTLHLLRPQGSLRNDTG